MMMSSTGTYSSSIGIDTINTLSANDMRLAPELLQTVAKELNAEIAPRVAEILSRPQDSGVLRRS
jgi:hypothetical protein